MLAVHAWLHYEPHPPGQGCGFSKTNFLSEAAGVAVYKNLLVDVVDTVHYFSLLVLSAFSWYDFKDDIRKQTAVAYMSTIITFIILIGVIVYNVSLLIRKDQSQEEVDEYSLAPVQPAKAEVTHSVIEIP